jgi:hypothetical protein
VFVFIYVVEHAGLTIMSFVEVHTRLENEIQVCNALPEF